MQQLLVPQPERAAPELMLCPPSSGAPRQTLVNNWRAVLGYQCREGLKYVRVEDNVALITNGEGGVALRCPVEAPDGYYTLNAQHNMIPVDHPVWGGYPDPLSFFIDFRYMALSAPMNKEICADFVQWLEYARRDKTLVYLDKDGAFTPRQGLVYPLASYLQQQLPLEGQETPYDPYGLKLAFTEMLRYDHSYICRRAGVGDTPTPLVVGHNWAQCAMVAPLRGYH